MANAIQSLADACSARSAHCSCRFMSSAAVRAQHPALSSASLVC
jgi:hypothetical protein